MIAYFSYIGYVEQDLCKIRCLQNKIIVVLLIALVTSIIQ